MSDLGQPIEISGKVTLAVQWDADHHHPAVLIDGRSLADIIAERFGRIKYGQTLQEDVEMGEMIVTVQESHG